MKYTLQTFRAVVDQLMIDHVGLTTNDLPDVSLWDYFDPEEDYTQEEILEAAMEAVMAVLEEGDCPQDVIDSIVRVVTSAEARTLRGI